MENLCHTLVGAALARAGLDRLSPLATTTMLVAANLPDVDVISGLWGDLAYLEHHRGITHSVVGLAVEAPLLAGFVCLADRLVRRRRDPERPPARFWPLVVVALVGLASHVLLDFTNSYGVKPWLPFDATWYYGDIVFVVDPWLWLLLGGALFLGARRSGTVTALWSALFAVLALAVIASGAIAPKESVGATPVAIWLALLASIVAVRWRGWSLDPARLAVLSLVGLVLYWGALAVAHRAALATVGGPQVAGGAIPTLMRPDRWRAMVVTPDSLSVREVGLFRRDASELVRIDRNLSDPAVQAAMQTCPGVVASAFNRYLYAEVDRSMDGRRTVLLRDARFETIPGRGGFATTPVTLDANLRPVADARTCPKIGGSW